MDMHQVTVDGKNLGRFKKTSKFKKLAILKGVEVRTVKETEAERTERLAQNRAKRLSQQKAVAGDVDTQPSLIDGVPTVKAYHK